MLMCNETVTLIHQVKTNDGETYVCTVLDGVSWFAKSQIALQQDGFVGGMVVKVRIPEEVMPTGITPVKGDYMARGAIAGITKLKDLDGTEHFKVMTVGDNRRGSLRHWAVTGT